MFKHKWGIVLAGLVAGAVNGLFGAGGGMVLISLLTTSNRFRANEIFPASVSIILPVCIISLLFSNWNETVSFTKIIYYLAGSAIGGVVCGYLGNNIPVKWLHRILGAFILWGGVRYLC